MGEKDAPVLAAIKEAVGSKQCGRKKVIALVQRQHRDFGSSRIRRVYEQYGYALFKRPCAKRRQNKAAPACVPLSENMEWGIDFMHDALANNRQIRSLNVIDPFNRVCKGMYIHHSMPAKRVIEYLQRAIEEYGKPTGIRTDNGPEFISKRFQLWLHDNQIKWIAIRKGKPQENCFIERFNRTAREELFNATLFESLDDANEKAAKFKEEYNTERPHESLHYQTPMEYGG
jgi:putative transposase